MHLVPNTRRFPVTRIAVTVPPAHWFHGIPRAMYQMYRDALAALDFEIFDVPVDSFFPADAARIDALVSDLKLFKPELAFGLSKGAYALICRMPERPDGSRPNLFLEVLDVPTICLWDHAPLELADQLLPHPATPAESAEDALETLRRSLTHPQLIHWSPDSGQTQLMQELGLLRPTRVIQEPLPALPGFDEPSAAPTIDAKQSATVGFIGHFYQEPHRYPDAALGTLADETIAAWIQERDRSLWHVLMRHIADMDPGSSKRLALRAEQTYFWHFAHRVVLHQAQTAVRLHVLGSAGAPVACYGNLNSEIAGTPGNLTAVPGFIPFGPPLAAALTRHAVTIDVLNPGSIHGYSHKPGMAFAAGGFMLVDRKRDFVRAFGDAGEQASYDDDLDVKVERFLAKPRFRREVRRDIQATVRQRFQIEDVLARVVSAACQCATV